MQRIPVLLAALGILFGLLVPAASAGGWAVVTLDAMPGSVMVNQPLMLGMTIRQHGQTAWVYENVRVRGVHPSGETFTVPAKMDRAGHYLVTLKFSRAGEWQWAVASGLAPEWQTMPPLNVASAPVNLNAAGETSAPRGFRSLPGADPASFVTLGLSLIGLFGTSVGLFAWWRVRRTPVRAWNETSAH